MTTFTHNIDAALSSDPSLKQHYNTAAVQVTQGLETVKKWYDERSLPLLRLSETTDDLDAIQGLADNIANKCKALVILGTGGSSLGGQTLYQLVDLGFGNQTGRPKLHFLDNVDPVMFDHLIASYNLADLHFIVISKSGGTAETLSQFLLCLDALSAKGLAPENHVTCITENTDNPCRALAQQCNIHTLDHDPKVGGRFSVLSIVGLLPAMVAGIDVKAIRAGAQEQLELALGGNPQQSPAALGAALSVAAMTVGKTISVLMPYCDQLSAFGLWYRQLWAESIGKQGKGSTPVRAMGTVDQHSQVQLYLDGPKDKLYTFIMANKAGSGVTFKPSDSRLAYLNNKTMGDLLAAEQLATAQALQNAGLPVRRMTIDMVDAKTLGGLLMHFMLETILTAELLGVDAFDQPAVEQGKILTRQYLQEGKLAA